VIAVLLALPAGALIGAIGVGGVLLPPALVYVGGLDIHTAAGTSSWCFLFTGVVGTLTYARGGTVPWGLVGRLTVGIAPAALLGALVNGVVSATVVWLLLGAITLGAGVHRLSTRSGGARTGLGWPAALAVGAGVGFGSAMTGTGGPVLLVPVLLVLDMAPLTAIAASQVIQLPLVGFAVLGYAATDSVDPGLGTQLGILAAAGVVGGALTVSRLRPHLLNRVAAVLLIAVGAALFTLPALLT
jgi:uncharacterized membrane protein YfcA